MKTVLDCANVLREVEGRFHLKWVRGHADDTGNELADAVKALDVSSMTPLEALNKLYELQEKASSLI